MNAFLVRYQTKSMAVEQSFAIAVLKPTGRVVVSGKLRVITKGLTSRSFLVLYQNIDDATQNIVRATLGSRLKGSVRVSVQER